MYLCITQKSCCLGMSATTYVKKGSFQLNRVVFRSFFLLKRAKYTGLGIGHVSVETETWRTLEISGFLRREVSTPSHC